MKFMFPTIKLHIERWKFNKDYGVWVSTHGHFRNRDKADLPVKINAQGYCKIRVHCTTVRYMSAHRLVMLTWHPTDEAENLTVDHKDHNKRNNSVDNLEWVSYAENQRRAKEDQLSGEDAKEQQPNVTNGFLDDTLVLVDKFATMTLLEAATKLKEERPGDWDINRWKTIIAGELKENKGNRCYGHKYTLANGAPTVAYKHLLLTVKADNLPYNKGMLLSIQPEDGAILSTASALNTRINKEDFSSSTFTQICRDIISGKNTTGSKNYYGFEIKGVKA